MRWENPHWIWLLWILPLVAGLLWRAHRKRAAAAARFADHKMAARLMPRFRSGRPWLKSGLLLAGLAMLILAAARPQWGIYYEHFTGRGVDLTVLLDVSRSMLAEDVAPNRLGRAKADVRDLLSKLVGDRVGLVVFAGTPVVKVPLTTDQNFFRMILEEVGVHSAPRGGSHIGDGIRTCLDLMQPRHDRDQVILLITDGEDHDSYPKEAAKKAAERNVKIFAIGLGDPDSGTRIPLRDDSGQLRFVEDKEGRPVESRMNASLLREMALLTNGAYIPAGTRDYDLADVYKKHIVPLARGNIQTEKKRRYRDRYQLFVALGFALLLIEMLIADYPSAPWGFVQDGSLARSDRSMEAA